MQEHHFSLSHLAELMIKDLGIHEGKFEPGISFRVGVGPVQGPPGTTPVPGAIVGIEALSLRQVPEETTGDGFIDASKVNPAKKGRAKRT